MALTVKTYTPDNPYVIYSPYTWHADSTAKTMAAYNSGAYIKFMCNGLSLGGKAVKLYFDVSGIISAFPPILAYRIGGYNWVFAPVAETITITLPAGDGVTTLDPLFAEQYWHFIEVWVRTVPPNINKWGSDACKVVFKGIEMSGDDSVFPRVDLFPCNAYPLKACVFGDSITEGYATMGQDDGQYKNNNTIMGWAYGAMQTLGCEAGIVGYSGQGFTKQPDNGAVPKFTETYNLIQPGINRDLSDCDIILMNMGTNDFNTSQASFVPIAMPVIQRLTEMTPKALVIILTPFNQMHAASWKQVVAIMNSHVSN